jgi:uncharacterized protein (DUF169 family)
MAERTKNAETLDSGLRDLLDLAHAPVSIAFCDGPPPGVPRAEGEPAGCGYWKAAGAGRVFYTDAADHHGCPVGAHVHNVPLPPEAAERLQEMVGTMVGLEYIRMEEVAALPRLPAPFRCAVYAPLARTPLPADVVLVRGNARQMMLLAEAAQSAGAGSDLPAMGRPTCAVIPAALASGRVAASFGCAGNRVYTGAGEDEAWCAIPGAVLGRLVDRLAVIVRANRALDAFHRARLA